MSGNAGSDRGVDGTPSLGNEKATSRLEADRFVTQLVTAIAEETAQIVIDAILPKLPPTQKPAPRYMTVRTAAAYMDKTYEGMRYTLRQFSRELPIITIGDKPLLDVKDIDRFMATTRANDSMPKDSENSVCWTALTDVDTVVLFGPISSDRS